MKSTILIAISLAALSLAGCKKDAASTNEQAGTATPSDEAAMASASPAASTGQTFADTASASDMFEIETSKLAVSKSQSAKVKRFAEQMIKAHSQSTAKLKTAAGAASPSITPAGQMSAMQQQALTDLSGKTGADFDTAYAKALLYIAYPLPGTEGVSYD